MTDNQTTHTEPRSTKRLFSRRQRLRLRSSLAWRQFRQSWQVFAQSRLAVVSIVVILLFGLMAISHPILRATIWKANIYDPEVGYDAKVIHPSSPSSTHLLGTDALGRDVLSMLLAGTGSSFAVGVAGALVTALVGVTIGVTSAYYQGTVDAILMHIADAFILLPAPLFMVIIGMRFRDMGPLPLGAVYGVIAGAGGAAVVMRSQAMKVVAQPFVEAARIKHVVPHMLPLAALYMMLAVTNAVVADAFISFFGFTRTYLNWGTLVYMSLIYSEQLGTGVEWHTLLPPGAALTLFASSFYFVSRGLHRIADPRLRSR
jgi:peptide/nickel transport system permease protein